MDDAAAQRRFTRAYESDAVDSDEMATALKRYDELDPNEKRTADEMVARGGDDGVSLLDEQVCNSPCDSFTEAWHGLKQTDSVSAYDATTFRNNLRGAMQRDSISDDRAADLLGDAKKLATDEGRDVTDVINRDDRFSRALIRQYDESDSVGTDTLRRMDRVGEIDLPDNQVRDKYKHADDFGVTGDKNPDNIDAFKQAVAEHTADPDTRRISGTYRGDPVTHLYNSRTDNNIIVRPNGEFLSGWELSPSQKQSVTSTGELS